MSRLILNNLIFAATPRTPREKHLSNKARWFGFKHLICAPLVIIFSGRVVVTGGKAAVVVEINREVSDMAIDEADHIFGIVHSGLAVRQPQPFMPGKRPGGGEIGNQSSFSLVMDGGEFPAKQADVV